MKKSLKTLKLPHVLILVLVLAFLVRLIGLNQSIWLDEGTTAQVALHFSIPNIISTFSPQDFHPPLFYIIEKIWTSIFGYSEVALRFPSVIFSLLAGYVVYLIGKTIKDETVGLWSAVFFLFNPLIMFYSQEARMYMMTIFFLSTALLCFLSLEKKNRSSSSQNLLYFFLFLGSFLSFLTFYGSVFFILAMILYAAYRKDYTKAGFVFFGLVFAGLMDAPLLLKQLHNSHVMLSQVSNWQQVLGKATVQNFVLIFVKFATGRISFFPKMLYFGIAAVWCVALYAFAFDGFRKKTALSSLFAIPLLLGVIFSFFTPLLQYFRFLYLILPLSVALALGTFKNLTKWIILVGLCAWSFAYLLLPQFHREDWKNLAVSLPTKTVYAIPSSMEALSYYRPDIAVQDIRAASFTNKMLVVIPYTTDVYGLDYKAKLSQKGYHIASTHNKRGVSYEVWQKL
jgi:uncharacterized membrane protein